MVFEHALNPVLLELGPLQIRWYGLMWALGFLAVYWYLRKAARTGLIRMSDAQVDSFMVWGTIGTLVGARLFEVFVWNWPYYAENPAEIVAVWHGGLSFHGGLAGVVLAAWLFCRKYRIGFLNLADVCVVPLALGQAFGRVGNFINGELWGRETSLPWGVKFPGAEGYRHPSQLYEAFYNVVIFGILWGLKNRKLPDGSLLALFLILYSIFRFITEFFRDPQGAMFGPLTLGQALNIPMLIAGIWLLWLVKRKV